MRNMRECRDSLVGVAHGEHIAAIIPETKITNSFETQGRIVYRHAESTIWNVIQRSNMNRPNHNYTEEIPHECDCESNCV